RRLMPRASPHSPCIRSPLNVRTPRRTSCRPGSPLLVSQPLRSCHSSATCVPPATRAGGSAEEVETCEALATGEVHEHTPSELSLAGWLSPPGCPALGSAALSQRQSGSRQPAPGHEDYSLRLPTTYCFVRTCRRADHGTARPNHNAYADGAAA